MVLYIVAYYSTTAIASIIILFLATDISIPFYISKIQVHFLFIKNAS